MELSLAKSHVLRHTWGLAMHKRGAKLADIGKGLGHSILKTTSDYTCKYWRISW